jgi:hypothetical protein
MHSYRRLGRVAALWLAVACGGDSGGTITPVITPPTPVVTTVSVAPGTIAIEIGATTTFGANVFNQFGAAMLGQSIAWTSSNPGVATVDASSGVVSGVAVGTSTITASVAGKSATATVTVTPPTVFAVTIAALAGPLLPGQTVQLATTVKDRNGVVLLGRTITWTTSAATVATVDNAGKVTAVAAGTATIFATSEGIIGALTVSVSGGTGTPAPVISAVSPATLVPGGSATITGTNFDAVATNNLVTVGGVAVNVTSASATQLVISSIPCLSSGGVSLKVTTNALTGPAFTHPLAVTQRPIAAGQAIVLTTPGCNELPSSGSGRYIVSVFSTSSTENALTDFELAGNTPAGGIATRIPVIAPAMARGPLASNPDAARDREHFAMLERNRAIFREGQALTARQPLRSRSVSAARAVPVIGDTRDFFYTYTGGCRDTTSRMHTKVLYAGTRAIIWEDTTNTLLAKNDAALGGYYQRLGQIFDQDQYDVVKNNFGDPLRRDASLANDGRVHMVFSQKLNGSGAAAFVTACDQYPTTTYVASNFGLVFYGSVPTTAGSNLGSTAFPDGWFIFMGRTVVHEVKHIASFSARIANSAFTFEESWLEEGTARHAEELWVRGNLEKVAWKGNTGFGTASTNGVYCDFHPENATCNAADALRRPSYGMRRHFNEIRNKLLQPWNWSVYGDGTGQTGSVFYQTTWSLVRYAIDRYGVSDADFLTRLNNSNAAGLSNLSTLAGVSSDQLMGGWGLALYADDYPGLTSPSADIQFPTWNLRSIYAGLNADPTWGSQFTTPYPITPVALTFGTFTTQRTGLRGGANAYFELSGTASTAQLLNLRPIGGGTPAVNLRMAIARLQ